MLTETACEQAGDLLRDAWKAGRQMDGLPAELRPNTREEGYLVQAALAGCPDRALAGWKIAATSKAGQAHINVDGPIGGRILGETLLEDGQTVALAGNNMRVAEIEFAFRFGCDLAPREGGYSDSEVRDAVAALHPAVELPASRFTDFCAVGAPSLIADNSCAHQFLIGEAFEPKDWRGRDLAAWEVHGEIPGKGRFEGIGRNVLDDPWIALGWLVNECSTHGITLYEGQFVSTGTCLVPVPVDEGDRFVADYGMGPRLTLTFE